MRSFDDFVAEQEAKMTPEERELLEKCRAFYEAEAKRIQEERE